MSKLGRVFAGGALPTAPSSPGEQDGPDTHQPLLLTSQKQTQDGRLDPMSAPAYPTPPPSSSSSSSTRKVSEAGSDGSSQTREADILNSCHPLLQRLGSGSNVLPVRTRRQTAGLNPLSSVTTSSSVNAAHISNPSSSRSSSIPSISSSDAPGKSALSSLTSHLEVTRLTDHAASPRQKNTPPLTPRALSNDGSESARQTPPSTDQGNEKYSANEACAAPTSRSSPPVAPPKGKLSVTIAGARGLRPSCNPYAVCAFEEIESIATGYSQRDAETNPKARSRDQPAGGVSIKASNGETGRSMAIPMKSRQSSTTSLKDQKEFKNDRITDPIWNHEALLSASLIISILCFLLTGSDSDVLGKHSEVSINVYDSGNYEAFLGLVKVNPDVFHENRKVEGWYRLEARNPEEDHVSGEVHLDFSFQKTDKTKFGPEDFQILKLIGKGCSEMLIARICC